MPKQYCDNCGVTHTSLQCFKKPRTVLKNKKAVNRYGKEYGKWRETRGQFIQDNPPDQYGFWYCALRVSDMCLGRMDIDQLTVDHIIPRSRAPQLRHEPSNLQPACVYCNKEKGSSVDKGIA